MKIDLPFRPTRLVTALAAATMPMLASAVDTSDDSVMDEIYAWGTVVQASSVNLGGESIAIKQADHVSDLLRIIPGIDVGGAHSLNQRITIRSMDDKDLRITIDGANQNTYMYHHMGNLQIHADILESVDVEVGTNSVINGGLGGAIRFRTKSASELLQDGERWGGRLQTTYGDNSGTNHALTGYGQITDSLDVLAYFNHVNRSDFRVGGGRIEDASGNKIEGTDGDVKGFDGTLKDALIKLGWELAPQHRIEIGYERYKDEGDYSYRPDMGLATDTAITNNLNVPLLWPTEFSRRTATLNYEGLLDDGTLVMASVFANRSELERDERGWADNEKFARWAARVSGAANNRGFNVLAETDLEGHTLTYGLESIRYQTEYRAAAVSGAVDRSSEHATHTSLYVQGRFDVTDKLTLIPGARQENYGIDSTVVDSQFNDLNFALAAEYLLTDQLLFKASQTELFKGPEIGEVFTGAGSGDTPNDDIKAETGTNTEYSLAYEKPFTNGSVMTAGLTRFETDIRDYIYDGATPPEGSSARSWKDNVGDMTITGHEAYLGFDKDSLSLLLTYSQAESELDADAGRYRSLHGARIDRQQGDTYSFSADYQFSNTDLLLHWDVLHVSNVKAAQDLDGASKDNSKDGFTVHNISARWKPAPVPGLALTLGVDNLFDEFYASQSSRTGESVHPRFGDLYLVDYEPGRNIKATLAYQF